MEPDVRDEVVDYVRHWSERTGIAAQRLAGWMELARGKFYDWRERYGRLNEHNAWVPRDHWLERWEKEAIVAFHDENPEEGYRRLTYLMIDADIVAVSPSSVYRVLSEAGRLRRWKGKESLKGTGFVQPLGPHEHWHTDLSYLNIRATFYYLCSILDGYSRFIVHWEIRESMKERDVAIVLQRAREKHPEVHPRLISDNGPAFIARDFKEFIRLAGFQHVRTSPYYPQSNGKLERWHGSLKSECIRPGAPLSLEEARRLVEGYVEYYNTQRLHSALGYITPKDMLEGRQQEIFAERERKLAEARERRRQRRRGLESTEFERAPSEIDNRTVFVGQWN